ncbi:unnamed protein product [Pelagomonas calceolata]|uniref:Uncharacterized protein n=1 Tax=Pelagomonas calceolata TaxID=35677 RepID=A0A8J2T0D6_9STRA|nr:unnamed protein product [Pelagomonas calceolata]
MADDASDGEVEDDADWRARVRRLRPFLLDADLVPPPPNPPDTSSSCFASWTRLHAKAPEPPGGFASDAGAKALDALLRDRRQAAPGAFARQCAALGGLDARRSHVLFEGELDIPTEDYYDTARALQNQRWSRQRAARAEDDLTHGRWADAVRRFGDAIALDATNGDAYRGRARARVGLLEGALFVSRGADTASYRVVDAAASTLDIDAGCSRLASIRPIIFGDEASGGSSEKLIQFLLAAGAGIAGLHSSADCVQGRHTACECKNRVGIRTGEDYPAGWVEDCRARVSGTHPRKGDGVSRYGVATTCDNYNLFPELFLGQPVFGGVRKSKSGASGRSGKGGHERSHASTPPPLLKTIMKGVDPGYDRVKRLFEVVFGHSDILKTILPLPEDTDPQAAAKAHYRELLAAKIRGEDVLSFDIERADQWSLTKRMRAENQPKGLVVAYEANQLGAVVGRLRPDLGKGDVEVILNEGQAKPFGEPRVRELMKTPGHDDKRIWSFGSFPEKDLLDHLGLAERYRNFHAVLSVALGMNSQGQHRNRSTKAPCPIATNMPMMGQMVNCDYDAVVKDPFVTPYQHAAAEKCLESEAHVSDPVATLQIMGMVATEGLKALRARWNEVDAYLLGDDTATRPALEEGHVIWYNASEANRKYDAPATEWPGAKMKPKKSRSGKRKAKVTPPPVPLSRYFGAAPPTAKLVLAGSGSSADPLDLSNSPSPPKRPRVEPLDELE